MRANDEWPDVPKIRKQLYDAQNGKCGYCGTPDMFLRADVSAKYYISHKYLMATFEHIVPDSHGGKYEIDNGVCICAQCNILRGTMPIEQFFERYDELYQYLMEKPARDRAKKEMNNRKNGYMIAWFAMQIGVTVDDIFLYYTPDYYHKVVGTLT